MMLPPATRVYLPCGFTDMRRGFDGLAAQVQTVLPLFRQSVILAREGVEIDRVTLADWTMSLHLFVVRWSMNVSGCGGGWPTGGDLLFTIC